MQIYTDGSHKKTTSVLRIGAWMEHNGIQYGLSQPCNQQLLQSYGITETNVSNPTAEFLAFAEVLKRIESSGLRNLDVTFFCDYTGINCWMTGEWKAKKLYIKSIRDICMKRILNTGLRVTISHVPGHSGVRGNEAADSLAQSTVDIDTISQLFSNLSQQKY